MTAPVRVLILNYEFPPMGGGAGNASFQIARTLASRGHAVEVVTSGLAGQAGFEEIDGVRIHRVRSLRGDVQHGGMLGALSYVLLAAPRCRKLLGANRYDVVHCFFGLPTGLLFLLVPGLARLPHVVSLRGSDVPGYDPDDRVLALAHRLLAPVSRRIWNGAGRVVANSEGLRRLGEAFLPSLAIDVIPNAIESDRFRARERPGTEAGDAPVELLSVARLIRRKGIDDLLQAVARLSGEGICLTLQGGGSDQDRFEALSHRLGLEGCVRFAGFKPRDTLPDVYRAADVFVLASHSESCAMALLEAMASGLPIIATDVGAMREHIDDGVNGLLVPPRDPDALAGAIRKLRDDPALRAKMGAVNERRVREGYAWGAIADRYLALYRELSA